MVYYNSKAPWERYQERALYVRLIYTIGKSRLISAKEAIVLTALPLLIPMYPHWSVPKSEAFDVFGKNMGSPIPLLETHRH